MTRILAAANQPILSIIIPALNDLAQLRGSLDAIRRADQSDQIEIIIADGGSSDGTSEALQDDSSIKRISCPKGRARQLNTGAEHASSDWLLFLHADSHIAPDLLTGLIDRIGETNDHTHAFTFTLKFRNDREAYRSMERGVAWRTKKFSLPYGDQGLCIHRSLFNLLNGFDPAVPMEDLDFILRMRGVGSLEMLPFDVHTSTRQWDREGIVLGIARNLGRLFAGIALHYLNGRHLNSRALQNSRREPTQV